MKISASSVMSLIGVSLAGRVRPAEGGPGHGGLPGHYAGIGRYQAGLAWLKMVAADQAKTPAAARIADDEFVIAVIDSHTGEVRQCGKLSGYCIAMNPGAKPLSPSRLAPNDLTAHAPLAVVEGAGAGAEAIAAPAGRAKRQDREI